MRRREFNSVKRPYLYGAKFVILRSGGALPTRSIGYQGVEITCDKHDELYTWPGQRSTVKYICRHCPAYHSNSDENLITLIDQKGICESRF